MEEPEEPMYEIMNPGKDQELAPVSGESYTYTVNDSYRLQTCQQKNTATGADDGGSKSVGGGEVEHSMKGDSQKGMKRCLIALVFAVVLMAVVTIAALALAVVSYSLTSQAVANFNTVKNYIFHGQIKPQCGAGLWYRVAFLNMSDPSQQCPSAWRLVTNNGVRACGRPVSSASSCPGTFYSATSEYQRVCGRVIGYQDASPDGFSHLGESVSISEPYLDGVSVTYGQPRNHIWSYACGVTERSSPHLLCIVLITVHVPLQQGVDLNHLLVITTTVNRAIQLVVTLHFIPQINFGMVNSVKEHAVQTLTLPHGSVYASPTPQLRALKYVFVATKELIMKILQ